MVIKHVRLLCYELLDLMVHNAQYHSYHFGLADQ